MPTDTFLKLPEEKRKKIIEAAKKEFARVAFEETSIKNIVEQAGIARGSFYQYFESKEDVLQYILRGHVNEVNEKIKELLIQNKGDIFSVFIGLYDYIIKECVQHRDMQFYRKVFENVKASQDTFFSTKMHKIKPQVISQFYTYVDTSYLKVANQEELRILAKMLYTLTRKAIITNFKYASPDKARTEFVKQIEYLKYGVLKKEREEKE